MHAYTRRVRSTYLRLLKIGLPTATPLLFVLGACIAGAPEGVRRQTDQDGDDDLINFDGGSFTIDATPDVGAADPYALIGADPPHGPFAGGQRVLIRGNGFTSKTRVWFGAVEADTITMVPIDPTRLQITVPPADAGAVTLAVQKGDDDSTRRTLAGGYAYDAIQANPSSGPVAGGTVIEINGQGTNFTAAAIAKIGANPAPHSRPIPPRHLRVPFPKARPAPNPFPSIPETANPSSCSTVTPTKTAPMVSKGAYRAPPWPVT